MHKRFQFPGVVRYGAFGLAGVLLMLILACGGDDTPAPQATSTPQPTATPLDVGAIASALEQSIQSAVDDALAGITPAEGLSASEINQIVQTAVSAAVPDTASAEEIQALVETAVAASSTPGLSAGEITSLVSSAVASATAGQADPLTASQVEAIVTSAIAGIPTATPQPTSTPAPTPTRFDPRRGGIVPMMEPSNITTWDPHACSVANQCLVNTSPLYNGLFQYDPNTDVPDDIINDLIADWSLASDGVTYTFTIVDNAKWSDGTPVTAADVVFSLDRMVDTDAFRPHLGALRAFYDSSRVIDNVTAEVTTLFPAPAFVPYLAADYAKVLPKHHFEGMSEDDANLEANILGSGPFKLKNHQQDISWEIERNNDYFKPGLPYFDGIEHFIITDGGRAFSAFSGGQVLTHAYTTNNLSVRENEQLGELMLGKGTIFWGALAEIHGLWNPAVAPFDDVRVRKAVQLALDRQKLIELASAGRYPIGAPFQPDTWFGLTDAETAQLPGFRQLNGEKHPDDIAEALSLMDEAGWGGGFESDWLTYFLADWADVGAIVVDLLNETLGANITLTAQELGTAFGRILAVDFEMAQLGFGPLVMDPHDFIAGNYMVGGSGNLAGYSNDRVNEIFELQKAELDQAKRLALVDEVRQIVLYDDPAHMFMFYVVRGIYVDNRIRNYHPPGVEVHYLMTEHMWCDPSC